MDLFKQNVKTTIDECSRKAYEPPPINVDDPHAIRFSQMNEETLDKVKLNMLNSIASSNQNVSPNKSINNSGSSSTSSNANIKSHNLNDSGSLDGLVSKENNNGKKF